MTTVTDPARELVDFCRTLPTSGDAPGDLHIAKHLGIEPWGDEFCELLLSIQKRISLLRTIVKTMDMDADQREEAFEHLGGIQKAFQRPALFAPWNAKESGRQLLNSHLGPLSMLSTQVRKRISYPKLDANETTEIAELVESLISELESLQLNEKDFVRQALIEGLKAFHFRLKCVGWLGWGFVAESLREVIHAYLVLERGFPNPVENPIAGKMLKITKEALVAISNKVGVAKDVAEKVEFLAVHSYAAWSIASDTGVAGYLTGY